MDTKEWIAAYGRAWEGRDPEAVAELFTDDAVYRSHPFRTPHRGRAEIRSYWANATKDQRDVAVRFGAPVVEGARVAVEWWAVMGDAEGGPDITLPGCLVLRFDARGRCTELREYWHVEEGRHEAFDGWGA